MSSSGDSNAAAMYDDVTAMLNTKRCFDDIVDDDDDADDNNGRVDDDEDSIHSVDTEEMKMNNNVTIKDTQQQSTSPIEPRRGGLRSIRERIATPFTTVPSSIPSSLLGLRNMCSTIRTVDKQMSQTAITEASAPHQPSPKIEDLGSSSSSSSLFFPSPMFGHTSEVVDDVKPNSQRSHHLPSSHNNHSSSYMSRPSPSLALSPSMKNKRLIMIRVIRDRMSQISAILEKMEKMEHIEQ